ncbi:unnamed protein product [Blepharisma stoltei]|uniref:Uncharacterized protein n=1 Tax=Blepharisma stoltei TaxID=1481888 RepID=A0AAU9JGZ6_9CILI|nr:unnamed protein product [Blepharisma stoltei]
MLIVKPKGYREIPTKGVVENHWHNLLSVNSPTLIATSSKFSPSNKILKQSPKSRHLKIRPTPKPSPTPSPVNKTFQDSQTNTELETPKTFNSLLAPTKSKLLFTKKTSQKRKIPLEKLQRVKVFDFKPGQLYGKIRSSTPQNLDSCFHDFSTEKLRLRTKSTKNEPRKCPTFSIFEVEFPKAQNKKKLPKASSSHEWMRCSNVNASWANIRNYDRMEKYDEFSF